MNKLEILEGLAIRLEKTMEIKSYKDFIKEWIDNDLMDDFTVAQTESLVVKYNRKEEKLILETVYSNLEITQEFINNINKMSVNVSISKVQLEQLKEREENELISDETVKKVKNAAKEIVNDKKTRIWLEEVMNKGEDDSITRFKEDAHIDDFFDNDDDLIERETVKEKMDKKVKENAKKNLENEKLVKQIFKGNYKNYFNNGKRVKRYMIDSYNLKLFTKDGELNCNSLHEIMATVIPVNKKVNQNLVFIDDKRQIRYLVKCEDIKNMDLGIRDEVKLKYKRFDY